MWRSALLLLLVPLASACDSAGSDACAAAFTSASSSASAFCATFTQSTVTAQTGLPAFATACSSSVKKLSSACSCLAPSTGVATTTSSKTSSTTSKSSTSSTKTTSTITGSAGSCTVTAYASLSSAVKSCTNLLISNLSAPPSSTIDLQKLPTGAVVTFAGKTTFGTTADDSFDPIVISGTDVTITGAPGNVIDGNGQAYWDGQGSNGGSSKPDHFIVVKKASNLTITGLNIQNWPVHCFDITGNEGLTITNLVLDNSAGDAANSASGGLPAAHNSDGFDISSSDNVLLQNIKVYNQDDCVAVTSGTSITVTEMYCSGGHGLSIGSIGGKSNNTVNGVIFENSQIVNSQNGARIKTNSGTTGTVNNVTYQNITLSGITVYGIDVQQDYLNGGPTGTPTNGVIISDINFIDVTGTATSTAKDYYILCGSGSCSDFTFSGVDITGGGVASTCNYPSSGCP